jgi:hypothetical protein
VSAPEARGATVIDDDFGNGLWQGILPEIKDLSYALGIPLGLM